MRSGSESAIFFAALSHQSPAICPFVIEMGLFSKGRGSVSRPELFLRALRGRHLIPSDRMGNENNELS